MPNIGSVLKSEISRIARKEVRAETQALKKHSSDYRSEIAALKKRILDLERQLKRRARTAGPDRNAEADAGETPQAFRFRASGLAAHRKRLGLSAREVGLLLGVSPLSVYKWEQGKSRPRERQMQAIAALRGLGKREAAAHLERVAA